MKIKYTNTSVNCIYLGVLIVIILTLINNGYYASPFISIIVYVVQVLLIGALAFKERVRLFYVFTKPLICISAIIVIINILNSSYDPEYSLLIKYFGYIVAVCVGIDVANSINVKLYNTLLAGLTLIPLFMVAFLDDSVLKDLFFPNSNNFVFWGAATALLYYTTSSHKHKFRHALIIIISYILVGSTIGIVLAFILTIALVNVRNTSSIFFIFLLSTLCVLLVTHSDITIFARIRAVFQTLSMLDVSDLKDLDNLNLYELNQYVESGDRSDNASVLWRVRQWSGLITSFFQGGPSAWFIGLGENFTTYKTGLPPHNDFLKILCEYGIIIFIVYCKYITKAIRILFRSKYIYFILTIVIFHFSENLIHTFPTNFILYFCMGYACTKFSIVNNYK